MPLRLESGRQTDLRPPSTQGPPLGVFPSTEFSNMPSIPTPAESTLPNPEEQTAIDADAFCLASYRTFVSLQRDGLAFVWSNAQGLTPQQACDAQGAKIVDRFRDHGNLTSFVAQLALDNGINPVTGRTIADDKQVADPILFPTLDFIVGASSVTILETPYIPPTLP